MASTYEGRYQFLTLEDPILDLTQISYDTPFLSSLLGRNFTWGQLPTLEVLTEAWERSPLPYADMIVTPSVIFTGENEFGRIENYFIYETIYTVLIFLKLKIPNRKVLHFITTCEVEMS